MTRSRSRRGATMMAVAEAAGVSVSTVSRVLSGGDGISQQTITRVQEHARSLGYPRIGHRRSPIRKRVLRLGLLHLHRRRYLPAVALQTPLHQQFLLGIWQAARAQDCSLNIDYLNLEDDEGSPLLAPRQVDALIVKGDLVPDQLGGLLECHAPLVFFKPPMGLPLPGSSVNCNYTTGIMRAVTHLHRLGHRRIAFFCPGEDLYASVDKVSAYQQSLSHLGLDDTRYLATPKLQPSGAEDRRPFAQVLDRWLAMAEPPTAIITSEAFCHPFLELLRERSIDVPGQMSLFDAVTGASNRATREETEFFTRLELPVEAMTTAAVEQALRHIREPNAAPQAVLMDLKFIEGQSTAPPR